MAEIRYVVVVSETATNDILVENSIMTGKGLMALLKYMTNLNRDGRNAFMYEVQRTGISSHIPDRADKLQYSVAAIEKEKA